MQAAFYLSDGAVVEEETQEHGIPLHDSSHLWRRWVAMQSVVFRITGLFKVLWNTNQ